MDNRENHGSGNGSPPVNQNGDGQSKGATRRHGAKDAVLSGNEKLIERVRQIISETSEIRPEKVGPLLEAVEQGTYSINVRKLANILITKMFREP
jgi:anti-sigma28 factor (negative regulator of flagellin synthesis)